MKKFLLVVLVMGLTSASAQVPLQGDRVLKSALLRHLLAEVTTACSCQIDGIAVEKWDNKSTWRIDFHNSKGWGDHGDNTQAEVTAAEAAKQAFDIADPKNRK